MRGYKTGIVYRRTDTQPYVEIWEQPFLRWVIARSYHLWEARSEIFMKYVSKWHQSLFSKTEDYVPLVNRRDIKCYYLQQERRTTIAIINITKDQYFVITGNAPMEERPRHEIKEPITVED